MAKSKKTASRNKRGYYPIKGVDHVSVTTFLKVIAKPFLLRWYAEMERKGIIRVIDKLSKKGHIKAAVLRQKMMNFCHRENYAAERYMFKRGDIGNKIHKVIQVYLETGKKPKIKDKKVRKAFKSFLKWWDKGEYRVKKVEFVVSDNKKRVAGQVDVYLERVRDGKFGFGDWKTGKGIYADHHLQNVVYRYLARKTHPSTFGIIVHVPQDGGKTTVHKVNEKKYTLEMAWHALDLWRGLNES